MSKSFHCLQTVLFKKLVPRGNDIAHFCLVTILIPVYRVPNKYDEYDKLPHYFFAFPSPHLDGLRNDYTSKTLKGIEWIMQG